MTIWEKFISGLGAFCRSVLQYCGLDKIFFSSFIAINNENKFDNVLFYGNYSIYGSNYQVEDIQWDKITKAVYAFGMVGNSSPDPDAVETEWTIYEKTRTLSETGTGLTQKDINDLQNELPILTSPLLSGKDKIYNLLDVMREGKLIQTSINELKEGDKLLPKLPGKVSTSYGVIDKSQADQLKDVKYTGYPTGQTGYDETDKYNFELYSTDPWSDFHAIDKAKYKNGLDNSSGYWAKNTMATFIETAHANNKPAILSIGGWSCSVTLLDAMKTDPKEFAAAVAKFVNETVPTACEWKNNAQSFDGIDIDLEPFGNNWSKMTNSEVTSVVESLTALRAALGSKSISFTIGANPNIVTKVQGSGADLWNQINKAVDKVYIMTYDYHGSFDGGNAGTNFHTALYADPNEPTTWGDNRGKFNIDSSMTAFSGVLPKDKLLFGAATYGRAYKLGKDFSAYKFDSYQPSNFLYKTFNGPKMGDNLVPIYNANTNLAIVTGNLGYNTYVNPAKEEISVDNYNALETDAKSQYYSKGYSIKEMLEKGDLKESLIYLDKNGKRQEIITYSNGTKQTIVPGTLDGCKIIGACALHKNGYFLTYDNELTIAAKAQYCKEHGYGGIIHWEGKGDVAAELVGAAHSVFEAQ